MRTGVTFALLVALCVLLGPIGSVAPVAAAPSQSSSALDGSSTTIEIQLQRDGDARISIVTTVPVQGKNNTAGFKEAAKEFEVGELEENTLDAFRNAVQGTSNATNRQMSIENIERNASLHENVGRFVISFTWRNFAVVTNNGKYLRTNNSFSTTNGIWLPGLSRNQTLIIRAPPGYHIYSSPIPHHGQSLQWTGPQSFKPGFANVTYAISGSQEPPSQSQTPASQPTPLGGSVSPFMLAVGAAVLIVIGSIGIVAFSRRDGVSTNMSVDGGIGTDGVENPGLSSSDSSSTPGPAPDPDSDTAIESVDPDPVPDTETSDTSIDLGLLSDEERVERLLRRNDGRMRQANIVHETDWSDAKVSQLLSAMDEAGRIEKLRIGRENLISLSDDDPDSDS